MWDGGVVQREGEDFAGVLAADLYPLAGDHDAAAAGHDPLDRDRCCWWRDGWWSGRSGAAQAGDSPGGQRAGHGAQQGAVGRVEHGHHAAVAALTDAAGFPLMLNAFEGNKAETTTMLPTITAFTTVRCYRAIHIQAGEHLPRIYDSGHYCSLAPVE
ncbi:hypothetical protein LWC34_28530 [Kibdelosporangium philippinense]|uniref:Uncharacterized protein n=2 Tax=Kibdelosporangium philippinense TaxID=211113 RepID=A0ABS8ZHB6_9PSEU|nr:hypothetical protein [Kibdelosporangium philippinense]MCE7006744.1 hypothetical protein [Kibdelosporangium philippinense]